MEVCVQCVSQDQTPFWWIKHACVLTSLLARHLKHAAPDPFYILFISTANYSPSPHRGTLMHV